MEQQQKELFNSSVDKMDRIYNLMLFSIEPKRAIEIEEHMELENQVYKLTNISEIQHIDKLINGAL